MFFIVASTYVALRGSYYLTVLCVAALLVSARKRGKPALLPGAALVLGVLLGIGMSIVDGGEYHRKLIHPALNQLPTAAIYLDFFSVDAWNIAPGKPVLIHSNCLPVAQSNDSAMIRALLYLEAVKLFLSAPLLGIGVSNFSQFSCLQEQGYPHSTILHVASEMGLVGLGLLVLMLWKSLSVIRRAAFAAKLPYWFFFLFVYYLCLDQLYGSYFSSSVTYFMAGLASRLMLDERVIIK
jgi:hypothetical protein